MNVAQLLATWFGAGRAPAMPGTVGSLAALPFAYLIHITCGSLALLAFSLLVYGLGVWACRRYLPCHPEPQAKNPLPSAANGSLAYARDDKKLHDPSEVVIDEVAGQCLLLAAFAPTWQAYALGFIAFRLFDIVKPWPVSWVDRRIKGATGVMLDDMLAGAFGALALAVLAHYLAIPGVTFAY